MSSHERSNDLKLLLSYQINTCFKNFIKININLI